MQSLQCRGQIRDAVGELPIEVREPAVVAIGSAVIPYATIPTEIWLHRTGRLRGQWRLEATDDPRDAAWHDKVMRLLLNRPWVFAAIVLVAVIVLFVVLLIIGPPGGKG